MWKILLQYIGKNDNKSEYLEFEVAPDPLTPLLSPTELVAQV